MRLDRADILRLASISDRYTFHSHTEFCDGRAPMEAFARQAVADGFSVYGFTPHSPLPIESPCNMLRTDVPLYIAEADRIKKAYDGQCIFLTGMEIDYLGDEWGPATDYFKALPLDYAIGSVHFIPSQDGDYVDIDGSFDNFKAKMQRHFRNDIEYVVNTFFDSSEAMVRAGGFEIMGHPDKIAQNANYFAPGIEDSQEFIARVERLLDMAVEAGLIIEINTKARIAHGRIFPAERYLPRLVRHGAALIVNSDAHYPDKIDASRGYALQLLDELKHIQ